MSKVDLIRTDGSIDVFELDATGSRLLDLISIRIGAENTDVVNLRDGRVMIVNDNGWETETIEHGGGEFELKPTKNILPINSKATEIYRSVCRPGITHQIVGDVAIALG